MASRLFTGAVALALVASSACTSHEDPPAPPPEDTPAPPPRPVDVGLAGQRAPMPFLYAPLGAGFDALNGEGRETCLTGPVVRSAEAVPGILRRLAHPLSQAEVADLLGASDATLRTRWNAEGWLAEEVSAFLGDPRSVSLLYGVEIRTGISRLDLGAAAFPASVPAPGTAEFILHCGDDVVVEQELGAQAFLLFRFWFDTDEARATFERLVGVDVPLWELRSRLQLAAAESALSAQLGSSSVTILHGVLGYSTVRLGNGDAFEAALYEPDTFLEYVTTDGPEGLMSRATTEPGVIGYASEPWTVVTSAVHGPRSAPGEVEAAREALGIRLEDRLRALDRIRSLHWSSIRAGSEGAVAGDVRVLRDALQRCYGLLGPNDAAAVARCTAGASPEGLAAAGYAGTPALSEL
jgi:hypothetical protein